MVISHCVTFSKFDRDLGVTVALMAQPDGDLPSLKTSTPTFRLVRFFSRDIDVLLWQRFSRLFADHIQGVPVIPVRICLPGPLLMLSVRCSGAA